MKIRRKVTVVFGKWGEDTDFTIEPYAEGDEKYSEVLWIEGDSFINDKIFKKEVK